MTTEPEKKTLTEDVGGMFGFRVVWEYLPHWCDFKVYALASHDDDGPVFRRKDQPDSMDLVPSVADAEIYAEGYIKWDGCSHVERHECHLCGANSFKMEMALLKYLYCRAMALMNSTEDPWTADDKKLPEMKA
jgi:hypothetical protein